MYGQNLSWISKWITNPYDVLNCFKITNIDNICKFPTLLWRQLFYELRQFEILKNFIPSICEKIPENTNKISYKFF